MPFEIHPQIMACNEVLIPEKKYPLSSPKKTVPPVLKFFISF